MTSKLNITPNIRNRVVRIAGTNYKPLDNPHQIREELESLCSLVNKTMDPFEKSLFIVIGISYLQPFEDGNKRTARTLANAVLMAYDACPVSYRSVDEAFYKRALLLFYEKNHIKSFRDLFCLQCVFATENYF